jgi:hypothetical protein
MYISSEPSTLFGIVILSKWMMLVAYRLRTERPPLPLLLLLLLKGSSNKAASTCRRKCIQPAHETPRGRKTKN